jgi:single-stranded-DNA-specific exonuclease
MGTVCDVVPLTGENRVLVYWGIKVMQQTRRPGMRALAEVAGVNLAETNPETFGFRFGPRLNASGRLDTAKLSMNLLAAQSAKDAGMLAFELDKQNTERRRLQDEIFVAALEQAQTMNDDVLVVSGEGWSHGVVGIVASKLMEEFQKPTFVLGINDGVAVGSARSFGDYHLAKAIMASKNLTQKGGGHAVAAGVTLNQENIDAFREAVNRYFAGVKLEEQLAHIAAQADLELHDFAGLDDELIVLLDNMQPFGAANQQPLFSVPVTVTEWRPVGATQTHAKATLSDAAGTRRDAIGFGLAKKMPKAGEQATALFHLEHNEWNGRKTIQHRLIDVVR